MVNVFQSSRVAGNYNKNLFTDIGDANIPKPSYVANRTFTQVGESNVQIEKKETAKIWHYIIGAALIAGVVYAASKRLD